MLTKARGMPAPDRLFAQDPALDMSRLCVAVGKRCGKRCSAAPLIDELLGGHSSVELEVWMPTTRAGPASRLVRKEGFEPSPSCPDRFLRPARLPIPPLPQGARDRAGHRQRSITHLPHERKTEASVRLCAAGATARQPSFSRLTGTGLPSRSSPERAKAGCYPPDLNNATSGTRHWQAVGPPKERAWLYVEACGWWCSCWSVPCSRRPRW